jgi:hypothetical protein
MWMSVSPCRRQVRAPRVQLAQHRRHRVVPAPVQGLTLVHFPVQLKRFLRDRGYMEGLSRGGVGCVRGYEGVSRVDFVSGTAQVELESGRV